MPNNTKDFQTKKIKGDFAELICKHHFSLMGCDVNKMGIEDVSPSFAKLQSTKDAISSLKIRIQNTPDFLVVHPSINDASFVEVKFRKNIDEKGLCALSKELHKQYANFIDDGIQIYFYLLTNKAPYIYIMKANTLKNREITGGFYKVLDKALDRFPFFRNYENSDSFNYVYTNALKSALVDIFE